MAERTCITTGQTLSQHRLIRFVAAPDGMLWLIWPGACLAGGLG